MVGELVFFILAAVAVGTALGLLVSRNAIYSALFLVANFATVALLYLNLGAPFIALTQITVYAGAIMVLFLFVIMLLGSESIPYTPVVRSRRLVAVLLGVVLVGELVLVLLQQGSGLPALQASSANFGAPREIGIALFTQYLLPFEITSLVLLAAMVGAIVLTKADRSSSRKDLLAQKRSSNGTGG